MITFQRCYAKILGKKAAMAAGRSRPSPAPVSKARRYKYGAKVRTLEQWALYCNVTKETMQYRMKRYRIDPHRYPLEWVFRTFGRG